MTNKNRHYTYLCKISHNILKKKFFFLFLWLIPVSLYAQVETVIVGQVFDKYDKSTIPSVNVYFKNSQTGTTTNEEGYFILRTYERDKVLVFSSVGYKTKELKIKPGDIKYLDIELEESNTWLEDVFILPGVNPALEWMKKIRLMRKENNVAIHPGYQAEITEQDLILLSKATEPDKNKRLLNQLREGSLSENDSTLLLPLYMAESKLHVTPKSKEEISKNTFTSPEVTNRLVIQLLNGLNDNMNFYNNSVAIFGKSIVSPLASIGNSYYNYYLTDSISTGEQKEYEITYVSKNPKNLAFNGKFRFDSTSLAITHMEATLPNHANINYIHNLNIKQTFKPAPDNMWFPQTEEVNLDMTYNLVPDSLNRSSEIFIKKSSEFNASDTLFSAQNFAQSNYSTITLEEKLNVLDNTPLMKTAKWIADAALTSYARAGFIDFGRLQQTIRLTNLEGVRLNLPLRTNERLWKNISIGGYVGYGFRNKEVKYSAFGQFRLPTEKRHIFGLSYTDDYRRVDYDYNNLIVRESPWNITDDDIVNTLFSLTSGPKISPRREWTFSYLNDWNRNIESMTYLRANRLYGNNAMPMAQNDQPLKFFTQYALATSTRFSFDEVKYEDHLQRIYVGNRKPVIYATLEAGHYETGDKNGFYGKISGAVKQNVRLDIGEWNYLVDAGFIIGKVPYPLLEIPPGNEPGGIAFSQFNKMKYMEFASDKYINIYNEFVFNGILFNHIPLIKRLNLREMIAVRASFGSLSDRHREVLDYPDPAQYPLYLRQMKYPYVEASIGITNILRIITVQLNWRFTNLSEGQQPWGISAGLRFGF